MKYCFPRPLLTAVFWLVAHSGWAQAHKISLLRQYAPLPARLAPYLQKGETALFDRRLAANLLKNRPNALTLHFRFEQTDWELELVRHDIFSQGFFVSTGSHPNSRFPYQNHALHYKGTVKGRNNSMAAVSILNDQLVAVVSDGGQQVGGHINIGAVRETDLADEHIIYRDSDLRIVNEFACGTTEGASEGNTPLPDLGAPAALAAAINAEPVDMYFEADYSTYTNNGSNVTNVVNYVTALFNVVATIYDRDSILIKISGIKVWNVLDPYAGTTTTATALPAFGTAMANGFPGDLAHLLSQRGLGGGRAYVDVLCSGNSLKTAVSGNLSNSFGAFPTYSWSTMVIAHEAGHNFGSPHTQSCSWPGGAIDNCYATEGGCPPGPAPTNGGTIMSYCHLAAPGINLANGFGPLPGERIRSRVRNNTCIHPAVYFGTTVQSLVEENADVENNCLDYKLLTTKLLIPYKPSQPAAISLVPSGNTGLTIGPHGDVEIMPMNFVLDSSNLEQTIQLKVYNDALIENPETLTLNFTLNANGGNAVKRNSSTVHTLNITSLDHRPDSSVNELLYFEPFDTVTVGLGGWTQSVIHGNMSPNRWVVRNSGDAAFPTAAAYISNNGTANAYAGSSANDSTVVRLISPAINALTFSNIRLSYLYKCQGETMFVNGGGGTGSNGSMVGLDVGRVYVSTDNGSTWTLVRDNLAGRNIKNPDEVALPAAANNSPALRIAFEWVNNSSVVNNPPLLVDSISLRGTSAKAIQSAAHPANMDEALIGPFQTVHFYNPVTKNVMASLQNLSGHDFGCTKVELLRTGNGALPAWTAAADELVSAKAYRITAANNNATAPYRLTLYYTATEMNGWLAATGNSASSASIVKTDSNIVQLSPVSAPLFATAKSMANFGTAPHTAISGNFTGFSTFAMAKPFAQPLCPGNNIGYPANVPGSSYRWQMNTGSGFADLANGGIFSGVTADTLRLTAPPTSFYGHRFRCAITTGGNTVYSNEYLLKFGSTWLGGTSIDWENPANWSCGSLPDANTDVYVNNGATFYPQVNSSTTIRSLHTKPGTTVTIRDGAVLTVKN